MCAVPLCRWIWWDPRGSTTPWASPCSSSASAASQGLLWQVSGLRHAKRANLFFQMCGVCDMHAHALQMYRIRAQKYRRQTDSLYKGQGEDVCARVSVFLFFWGVEVGAQGFHGGPPDFLAGHPCVLACLCACARCGLGQLRHTGEKHCIVAASPPLAHSEVLRLL